MSDDAVEEKIAGLEKELTAAQYMLAFVLQEVGEPVVITQETLTKGLPAGIEISMEDDFQNSQIILSLVRNVNE